MARRSNGSTVVTSRDLNRERKGNPRSAESKRSIAISDYARFADDLRRDFNPNGPLERLMTEHVIGSAWRLKRSIERQEARNSLLVPDSGEVEVAPKRESIPAIDRSARSLKDAVEAFDYLRDRRPSAVVEPAPTIPFPTVHETIVWPFERETVVEEIEEVEEDSAEPEVSWQDRLVYDFEISDTSPVVKGTWITVSHVVSLIVDGWTWADILRSHPELTEDDVRTCMAFAVAEESLAS